MRRYADDSPILAERLTDLQHLIDAVNESSHRRPLKINSSKWKWMEVGKVDVDPMVEHFDNLKYLGYWLNARGNPDEEILTRIGVDRKRFMSWKPVLSNRNLSLHHRKNILK
ncbi:hypothetical protein HUJ05_013218 [Dendroctonus ponderosae]|nr:hypothetical protein HUJ05_013218 [Dendroctonus ponderosae]